MVRRLGTDGGKASRALCAPFPSGALPGKERLAAHGFAVCLRAEQNCKGSRLRLGARKIC